MGPIVLILTSLVLGWLARKANIVDVSASRILNRYVIYVSLPALTVLRIHGVPFDSTYLLPILMPWLHFGLAAAFVLAMAKLLRFDRATTGCLVLTAGLGNTSFLGFPLIEAYFGSESITTGIFIDQPGTFLILSVVGVPLATYFSGSSKLSISHQLKSVFVFPPFIALLVALAVRPLEFPDWLTFTLDRLGGTLAPIALVSVGIQMSCSLLDLKEFWKEFAVGLGFKLFFAPLVIFLLYANVFGLEGRTLQVTVFEAAMAPMITAGIVASEKGLNARLASLLVGGGIVLSLLTSYFWFHWLT